MDDKLFLPGHIPASRYTKELHKAYYLTEKELKKMAQAGRYYACRVQAKKLLKLRKQIARTNGISPKAMYMASQISDMSSQIEIAGALSTATLTMQAVNQEMDPQKTLQTMQAVNNEMEPQETLPAMSNYQKVKMAMQRHNTKFPVPSTTYRSNILHCARGPFGPPLLPWPKCSCHCCSPDRYAPVKMEMTEEMINDILTDISDDSDDEEKSEDIVIQVLDEIRMEIPGKVAKAPSAAEDLPSTSATNALSTRTDHLTNDGSEPTVYVF